MSLVDHRSASVVDQGVGCAHMATCVENHHGITLTAREQESVHTVGDLVALIHTRIESARNAHWLRRAAD